MGQGVKAVTVNPIDMPIIDWLINQLISIDYTPRFPRFNEVERGVYWYHLVRLSVCPSICLSICGQNRVHSVSSTILIGSISYLQILLSNFRRCVEWNARFKIKNLGCNMTQWYGLSWGGGGYPQNAGVLAVVVDISLLLALMKNYNWYLNSCILI